jgi:serine phosphatase RsbU (regulator of sigma subunit)/anti-sigma regulatory factor (Ser/Thr protein kinase)
MLNELGPKRLRIRLLTWAAVPTVIILAAVAVVTFVAYERVTEEELVGGYREMTYSSANRLKEEVMKFSNELATQARSESTYFGDPAAQAAVLAQARRRLAVFDAGVVLLDNFGVVVAALPERPEIAGHDWSDRSFFRQLLADRSVVFSNALDDGPDGSSVIVVAVPVTSPNGELLGALAGMFRLGKPTVSAFYASIVRLRAGQDGHAYVVDGSGRVIYHPQPEQIGTDLSGDPLVQEVLRGRVGALRIRDQGQNGTVVAYSPVPGTPWGLLTEEDWAAIDTPSRRYGRFLFGLLVLGMVMPAVGFGLLARARRNEALERARLEHQFRLAALVQQTLLPREIPDLSGWRIHGHYQPAQAVGGDFYDFIPFEDGRIGLIIGDVTDKGIPAALVMATTRSLLRSIALKVGSPGAVLEQVNGLLDRDIPSKMFVTCFYAVLDPVTGRLTYANAGHNLPYRSHPDTDCVAELWATGMPLGLMPSMVYEERETVISPGECLVLYSDGLVEAHNARREMFGNPRLQALLRNCIGDCPDLIRRLLNELVAFAGRGWEQEDDVTLVTVQRSNPEGAASGEGGIELRRDDLQLLTDLTLPSTPGTERQAMELIMQAIEPLDLSLADLERLKTAVIEATTNALEHGNRYQPHLMVDIEVLASAEALLVRISDQGDGPPQAEPPEPDLEAKIEGRQSPRGWGQFLIRNMMDQVNAIRRPGRYTVELVLMREGIRDASPTA